MQDTSSSDPESIARAFLDARRTARAFSAYPGPPPSSLEAGYRVQECAIELDRRTIGGWKVGRIAEPHSCGVDADRLAGPVFSSDLVIWDGTATSMTMFEGGFGAVEAEFMLRVGPSAASATQSVEPRDVPDLIDAVHIGIEMASSPFQQINDLGPAVTVSDYGNNNGLLVGAAVENWHDRAFEAWDVAVAVDACEVGRGRAAAMPDGVYGAAAFLFSSLAKRGRPLRPGQWISTGAITGVHRVVPGAFVTVRFGDGLSLECSIAAASPTS